MTRATGPPPGMTEKRTELTPMLRQYLELCEEHEDALVLFQVGDFYEAFCEAAEEVARVCEVTLTKREDSTGSYPMAGLPVDNAASYLERLLEADYRVAVADQVEDAAEASGLVDRAVTRVVTPGTLVDDELLSGSANYVACVAGDGGDESGSERSEGGGSADGPVGLAAVDVSTGECFVTSGDRARIAEELDRIAPSELLRGPDAPSFAPADAGAAWMETAHEPAFEAGAPRETLADYLAAPDRRLANEAEVRACGAALSYAEYTQGDDGTLEYVSRVRRYDARDHLRLDAAVLRSLELFENVGPGAGDTVFDVLDETNCALGRRTLSRWLRRPLVDRGRIESRLDGVEELAADSLVREAVREELSTAYDLERLVGRVSRGRANARELRSLHATLAAVPALRAALDPDCEHLRELRERLDELADIRDLIDRAIAVDPPQELTEGGVVRGGFDGELDDLRATEREGREWVADLEAAERERTGIDSLSVGHNQVHGYYIEVTKANLDRVPDDYTRRQTLKNSERFYTPDLKRREDEILGASERADKLEYELFAEVRARVAEETDRLQALAGALGELDALCSLSTVAVARDYVRPSFRGADSSGGIEIEGGRHPVVEATRSEFVPNDADLPRGSVAVITGPNMSGKSTYMRQVALCVVLAQTGSFVPAEAARLPVVDRVFTRVGASDDIAGGQSTFMREMSELTEILHDATEESLVLLDEVGRGTSTADGLAIARATTEFIHDRLGATTLFATHYHDLTELAEERERVFNLHFAATREGDGTGAAGRRGRDAGGAVTFLHRVARGASSSSYGVEVARMAGVPEAVVERSRELVAGGAADRPRAEGPNASLTDYARAASEESPGRADGREADDEAVLAELRSLDVATVTPLEALNTLHDLRRRLESTDE